MEIRECREYVCPFCGTGYAGEEEALACEKAGEWLKAFRPDDLLWHWCILKNKFRGAIAYLPDRIDNRYTWTGRPGCRGESVTLFNSYTNSYASIAPSDTEFFGEYHRLVEVLGIREGFDKYGLVPPASHLSGFPEGLRDEAAETLRLALREEMAALDPLFPDRASLLEAAAGLLMPDLSAKCGDLGPIAKIPDIPQGRLISGNGLYELERFLPQFE